MTNGHTGTGPRGPSDRENPAASVRTPVRVVLGLAAAALFAFGLTGFLLLNGLTPRQYWWLMIAGVAMAILGLSVLSRWQTAGIVAATCLIGFGVQLALKDPFWFQQVRIRPRSGFHYLMLACLALQGMAAVSVLWQNNILRRIPGVLADLGIWRVLLVAACLVLASRSVMEPIARQDPGLYLKQLVIALTFLSLNIASFIALVIALPGPLLHRMTDGVTKRISLPGSGDRLQEFDRRFLYLAAGLVFVVCLLITTLSFGGVPHLDDIIFLFQAKSYASGLISLPLPPSVDAFNHYLMNSYQGRWFAVTFPGWPLALALGELVNMPWIVNPVLAAGSILLFHSFMTSMTDRGTANLAIVLMAVSPWYLSVSSTMLIHTFTWALALGAWVLLIRARNRPSIIMPLIAGALMGWLFLTRPLEGVLIGTLTGAWTLMFLRDRRHWKTVVLYSIGAIAIGALIFPYHAYLTGDPLLTPLNAYYDVYWGPGANALGFGPEMGAVPDWGDVDVFPGHSPVEALINAHQNLYEVNSSLLGWGGASLVFALVFIMWGKWTRFAAAMLTIIIATMALYSLYWFYGGFYAGARYWFLMLVPLLSLTALGITACTRELRRLFPEAMVARRVGIGIGFLCLCSLLVFESWLAFNRYPGINGYHGEYQQLARQDQFRNALVFISTDFPREYGSAFWLNNFSPQSKSPLFAQDLGPTSNRQVASAYPDREIFFVNGRSKNQPHVTVISGPLTLNDLE